MFLGVFFEGGGGSRFWLVFKKLLWDEPKNLKILKLDNIASDRYKMVWSHHVQAVRQHIRLYYLQLVIYSKIAIFCECKQNNPIFPEMMGEVNIPPLP